jgi:hypothetical protein
MPRIFIAPTNSAGDQADLDRSIVNAVDRHKIIRSFSDATYPELVDIERRGRGFYAWGLRGNPEDLEHWFQMGIGDFVLLSYKGEYRYYAKVLGRYENISAAKAIWDEMDSPENIREFLFFLTEPIPVRLPLEDLSDYLEGEPLEKFHRLSDAAMERITEDFDSVAQFFRRRLLNMEVGGPVLDMSGIVRLSEREQARLQAFDPESTKDGRTKIVGTIIKRRGQATFRNKLLAAYDHHCAFTGCNAVDALEAAYIIPYRGEYTHDLSNGLLLRSDLHTLFDLGKIAIDTRSMTVVMTDELLNSSYRILANQPLRFPKIEAQRPAKEGLDLHRQLAGL